MSEDPIIVGPEVDLTESHVKALCVRRLSHGVPQEAHLETFCDRCNAPSWLDDKWPVTVFDDNNARPVCEECMTELMAIGGDTVVHVGDA